MDKSYVTAKVSVNCIIVKDGKVLLVQQNRPEDVRGKWSVPGGKVNQEETFEDAVKREVKEETGLNVIGSERLSIKQEKPHQTVKHIFKVEAEGEVVFPEDELMDAKWFSPEEIRKIKDQLRKPWVLEAIEEYFE
ncbi:MAG: NUDIX domain-containing protein [Candidatus Azambacteria bacterium]|nr:NUDIX domain-containing protein [Candidatus Azambacteria bacterium]